MSQTRSRRVWRPLRTFLATESAGGIALVGAAIGALVWANSPWAAGYRRLWSTDLSVQLGTVGFGLDLRHWVNEGLMTIFFLVAGLEIKREVVQGELRDLRQAALPVAAAVGGMVIPALVYVGVTAGSGTDGWAVPMATDIAMVLGALALIRTRVHPMLPLMMLALAIVDDIGSIIVLAVGLGEGIRGWWILLAIGAFAAAATTRLVGIRNVGAYALCGVVCWFGLSQAGVPATLAGVAFGLLATTTPLIDEVDQAELTDLSSASAARRTEHLARHSVSVVERLEHALHPWASFGVVPLFALANAGIPLGGVAGELGHSRVFWGVTAARVIGKPVGIVVGAALAVRSGVARLPEGVSWRDMWGLGAFAGMGFAVAIFIASRSLGPTAEIHATLGVFTALVLSAALGYTLLLTGRRPRQ